MFRIDNSKDHTYFKRNMQFTERVKRKPVNNKLSSKKLIIFDDNNLIMK